jgi:hypothetical protein
MRRKQLKIPMTPEFVRSLALRQAPYIGQYGWRPSNKDLAELRQSTRDAIAYRTQGRAWRRAGFKAVTVRKLAGPGPAHPRRIRRNGSR